MKRAAVAVVAGALHAQAIGQHGAQGQPPAAPSRMQWIDLRENTAAARPHRQLWADRIDIAQRRWSTTGRGGPLPAHALAHVIRSADRSIMVSVLFDLYDCELPGNGPGADLYARCPLRVVHGSARSAKIVTVGRACHLHVPDIARPGEGPDPSENMTAVQLDPRGVLQLRVLQHGRPVPACDLDVALG
jgi:hypothetical protein